MEMEMENGEQASRAKLRWKIESGTWRGKKTQHNNLKVVHWFYSKKNTYLKLKFSWIPASSCELEKTDWQKICFIALLYECQCVNLGLGVIISVELLTKNLLFGILWLFFCVLFYTLYFFDVKGWKTKCSAPKLISMKIDPLDRKSVV